MKMNRKLMFAIPVVAGVMAIGGISGAVFAKGADQPAGQTNAADYINTTTATDANESNPVAYCGGLTGMIGPGAVQGMLTQQVASLLGTTIPDLRSQLDSGKTLAEIAAAKGVNQDQLVQTMMAPLSDQMGLMLKYGYSTQDQVNTMTEQMQQRLQTMMTSKIDTTNGYGRGFMGGMMQGSTGGMMQGSTGGMMQGSTGGMMQGSTGGMMGNSTITPNQPGTAASPRVGFGGMMGR